MKTRLLFLLCTLFALSSCHDDEKDPVSPAAKLPGTIYYDAPTEGVLSINMTTGKRSLFLPYSVERNSWDVSHDSRYILQSADAPDQDYDASHFTITNLADGTIVDEFKYYAKGGSIATGSLSPNGDRIAMNPTFEEGIVITDRKGKVITNIYTINDKKVEHKPVWLPDNTLLFQHQQYLVKTNADFTDATVVKQMEFADWGMVTASKDGRKIAFVANKHIWLMNADGSDMKQVTTSSAAEAFPKFSPDGKYLLLGTDYHQTGPFGYIWNLKVIPADGQQYQINDGEESEGVVPVKVAGESQIEAGSGNMMWR